MLNFSKNFISSNSVENEFSIFYTFFENNELPPIDVFTTNELSKLNNIKIESIKKDFTFGRYCAKHSILLMTNNLIPSDIEILNSDIGFPYISKPNLNLQINISHSDNAAAAICFRNDSLMGIDIELNNDKNYDMIKSQINTNENKLNSALNQITNNMLLWSAKESISKALKTGFTLPMELFEIQDSQRISEYFLISFKNFYKLQVIGSIINDYILCIACENKHINQIIESELFKNL